MITILPPVGPNDFSITWGLGGSFRTPKSDYVIHVRPLTYLRSAKGGQPCPRQQQQLLLSPPEFESRDCRPLTLIVQLYHRSHHNDVYYRQQCKSLTFVEAASLLPRSPMVISPQRFKFGQLSKESLVVCHDKSFLFSLQQHDKKTNTIEGKKKLDPPLLYVFCSSHGLFWLQAVLVCLARGVHLRRIYIQNI